jgi:hypothetical protein
MRTTAMTTPQPRESSDTSDVRLHRLRWSNLAVGIVHAVQAVIILALANDFTLPVTATFLEGPPGSEAPPPTRLFGVSIAWGVAIFLLLAAIDHLLMAAPGVFDWYARNLRRGRNYARWIEYAVSASLMVVLIAMLTGISDVAALGALFGVNAAMILFGLLMEHYERPGNPGWLPYFFGCIAGAVPWLMIGIYIWSPGNDATPPNFVYAIFVSLFIFFNSFAVNMVLQYKRTGPWRAYLFGEGAYIVLSLAAKSALAWQVFGGTLAS